MKAHTLTVLTVTALAAESLSAASPSVVLSDGGVQYPDGTVQETSAVLAPGPPSLTVAVDCTAGDTINDALKVPADELTIQISGMCSEIVVTSRPNVTFLGTDPATDGIDATATDGLPNNNPLMLINNFHVRVENLTLKGGSGGLGVNHSFSIDVVNCRLEDNSYAGAFVASGSALTRFWDTTITGNGNRGLSVGNAEFSCIRCTIEDNGSGGLGRGIGCGVGATVYLEDSTVEGKFAIDAEGCNLSVSGGGLEGLQITSGPGELAVRARDHTSVDLSGTTVTGPIWVQTKSSAELHDSTQTIPAGFTNTNSISRDSWLLVGGTTTLAGNLSINRFSKALIDTDASVSGDLTCDTGGDALCKEVGDITGSANCGQCSKP